MQPNMFLKPDMSKLHPEESIIQPMPEAVTDNESPLPNQNVNMEVLKAIAPPSKEEEAAAKTVLPTHEALDALPRTVVISYDPNAPQGGSLERQGGDASIQYTWLHDPEVIQGDEAIVIEVHEPIDWYSNQVLGLFVDGHYALFNSVTRQSFNLAVWIPNGLLLPAMRAKLWGLEVSPGGPQMIPVAARVAGVPSSGLLIPTTGFAAGQNVSDLLGIKKP